MGSVPTRPLHRVLPALAVAAALALAGCSGDAAGPAATSPVATQPAAATAAGPSAATPEPTTTAGGLAPAVAEGATVIDVRTAKEYGTGHVEGALNIDLSSRGFAEAVAALPREASYVVYCRTGNRSAQAARVMAGLGFDRVTDAGGLAAVQAAGVALVR